MSAFGKKLRRRTGGYGFWCEGCEEFHGVTDGWSFNGDPEKPTFSPSILVRGTQFTEKGGADYRRWYDEGCPPLPEGHKFESQAIVCHSFITDGKIQYLTDCTHHLAGKTIDLPDIDPELEE